MGCTEEHQDLKGKIIAVQDTLMQHVDEAHRKLLTVDEIEAKDQRIEAEIEELACQVLGKRKSHLMGGGRDTSDSMVTKLNDIYTQTKNGGIKARLSKGIVAILVAIIGAVGYLAQAQISSGSGHEEIVNEISVELDKIRDSIIELERFHLEQ